MRAITHHKIPGHDHSQGVDIFALDGPGPGGASHAYRVDFRTGNGSVLNPSAYIFFQHGPVAESGINGVSNEVLLAIVIDRLEAFQAGPYACSENKLALAHAEWALDALKDRTLDRLERGVEGTYKD